MASDRGAAGPVAAAAALLLTRRCGAPTSCCVWVRYARMECECSRMACARALCGYGVWACVMRVWCVHVRYAGGMVCARALCGYGVWVFRYRMVGCMMVS